MKGNIIIKPYYRQEVIPTIVSHMREAEPQI